MFVDVALASQIEAEEAALTSASVRAVCPDDGFVRELGGGFAVFLRPGSPLNKVFGLGFNGELAEAQLAEVEELYRRRSEAVRVELSTLALPAIGKQLTARGYRLEGYENVLGRALGALEQPASATPPAIAVEHLGAGDATEHWLQLAVEGFANEDDTGVVVDHLSRSVIEQVLRDFFASARIEKYLARAGGVPAGIASLRVTPKTAFFSGAATLPNFRRRGVQTELTRRRLEDAERRGCSLAIMCTSPGTRSQANAMKHGFSLLYSRAILIRPTQV